MSNCAWCHPGSPGDVHGSHAICLMHALEQRTRLMAARKARRDAQIAASYPSRLEREAYCQEFGIYQ